MTKILIYSHDTYGLGNIRRMLCVARHLVANEPDVSVLLLSGSPMLHAFRIPQQIDYVKLPCLSRNRAGEYGVKTLGLNFDATLALRANIILSTVLDFQPDVMIVDKKPLGIAHELAPTLERLKRRTDAPELILLLRDILDSPEATTEVWHRQGYFTAIEEFYDRVLVVGTPELFDLRREYRFPRAAAKKVTYCGYMRREKGLRSPQEVREELCLGARKLVLVTPGGGEDGAHLVVNYLQGLGRNALNVDLLTLILCGPEMGGKDCDEVRALAASLPNLVIRDFSDNLMSYMDAADLLVSMGGYNTVCEILTLNKPAILVPRVRPVQEQWLRAQRLAQYGLIQMIHPDELTPERLMRTVSTTLENSEEPAAVPARDTGPIRLNALPNIKRIVMESVTKKRVGPGSEPQMNGFASGKIRSRVVPFPEPEGEAHRLSHRTYIG